MANQARLGSPTRELADFISSLQYDDLPTPVVAKAKQIILDTIGCALGGAETEVARISIELERDLRPAALATILGHGLAANVVGAATVNARMAGALDADETFPSVAQAAHHASAVVASALALGELSGGSGPDLIAAVVAGYELGARFNVSIDDSRELGASPAAWRVGGGAAGVLGSAAAACRALGLRSDLTRQAIGIAGTHVDVPPIQWLAQVQPPMVKSMDRGWHAMTGITSAMLSQRGMTGYSSILDGADGLWRSLGYPGFDFDRLVMGLGSRWYILDSALKPWPSQRWMHYVLTALHGLHARNQWDVAAIERVILRTSRRSFSPMFHNQNPSDAAACQFSLPHAAAMILLDIPPGPLWFDDWAINSHRAATLRQKVSVEIDARSESSQCVVGGILRELPATAEVMVSGRSVVAMSDSAWGDPWSPDTRLSDDALTSKFRHMASPLISDSEAWITDLEEAITMLLHLDSHEDVRYLTRLVSPGRAGI